MNLYETLDFHTIVSLPEKELQYSKVIYTYLKKRVGKRNAKTCTEILLTTKLYYKMEAPTFRKIVHYLRMTTDAQICATSKGYYIAENQEELNDFVNRLKKRLQTQRKMVLHIESIISRFDA